MEQNFAIQLFEDKKVRVVWDAEQEKYFFAIVDIIQVLTESENPQTYWRVLKKRLRDEGNESVTNCNALKIPAADGKKRMTDVADIEQLLRLIQSIPSKKAEPVKRWLAEVGSQRIDQMIDSELTFQIYPSIAISSPRMHKAVATQPTWLAATSRNKSGIASYPRNVLPTTSSKTQKQQ